MSDGLLPLPVTASSSSSSNSKGKGKGKQTDSFFQTNEYLSLPSTADDDEELLPKGLSFDIRFTEGGIEDLSLIVGEKETVREVKRRIRYLRPSLTIESRPRRLRLIILGRILTDGILLVDYTLKLLSRRSKILQQETSPSILGSIGTRTAVQEDGKGKGKGKEKEGGRLEGTELEEEGGKVWLHCSVGEVMEDEEIEGERIQETNQITPLQGFDKLLDAGFSPSEIQEMRQQFLTSSASSSSFGNRQSLNALNDQDETDHARALEDQWMEGLTSGDTGGGGGNGNEMGEMEVYTTLLKGVTMGFFFPFAPLFFYRTQIFSKRMQMACILGIFLNFAFGLLRFFS